MKEVMVSISMVTYNQEQYIEEAIINALNQKVNFNFELVISDDCSNDNTPLIIESIIKRHPKSKLIRYVRHKKNNGMIENFLWNINNCKGKYIAICEGDDYWSDKNKLQMQVNFLENNTGISTGCVLFSETDDFTSSSLIGSQHIESKRKIIKGEIILDEHSQLGTKSVVMPGITIQEGAVTGAFTYVNLNLNPWSVYVGSPAKYLKSRTRIK